MVACEVLGVVEGDGVNFCFGMAAVMGAEVVACGVEGIQGLTKGSSFD